jgi:hypothetical protein
MTRREYIPVGLTAASLRPTVMKNRSATLTAGDESICNEIQ